MADPPRVKLGHQAPNGVAAGLLALVERGAAKRPRVAREMRDRGLPARRRPACHAPLVGGVPKLTNKRGRSALAKVAARRVRIEGSPLLARRVMKLLEV